METSPLSSQSQVPSRAWTGRSWWQVCCGGCCLGLVLLFVGIGVLFYWRAVGLPKFLPEFLHVQGEKGVQLLNRYFGH